jgi:hypothetical protein
MGEARIQEPVEDDNLSAEALVMYRVGRPDA